jgi:sigma-B regulation protein RsbU (phosphoserine phosphatase)
MNPSSEDQRRSACSHCPCFACLGVLWMEKTHSEATISSEDISLLSTIATQSGIIIDNHLIFNKLEQSNDKLSAANTKLTQVNTELSEAQAKINADLDHARKVQQGLLPNIDNALDYFSIGVQYIPAHAVGGDYYDMFEIAPGTYAAVIADVSGHGIASAFIMSMAKVLLKTISYQGLSPQHTLERINTTFLTEVKSDNFITIFYSIIDVKNAVMTYNSAGHCPVLLIDKNTRDVRSIEADGTFLGIFDDMMLEQRSHRFSHDSERLLLYTDGLTEAHNAQEEMFTFDRLSQIALDTLSLPPQKAVDAIINEYQKFRGTELRIQSPEDDVTLLVIDL